MASSRLHPLMLVTFQRRAMRIAGLLALVSACEKSTTPLVPSAVGAYVLTTVDLKPLPAAQVGGDSVLAGGAILYANGSYAINWLSPTYYFGKRDQIANKDSGSWTATGLELRFTSASSRTWSGAFDERTLSIRFPNDSWAFARP